MFCSASAIAEIVPKESPFDSRLRVIDYNKHDVVKLETFYGVTTHVQFGDDEAITDVAIGDDLAWNVVPRGNHLFIKPKEQKADTNVTVITNKRVYSFALVVAKRSIRDSKAWKNPKLVYGLSFRYPAEEAAKLEIIRLEALKQAELKARKEKINARLDAAYKYGNGDSQPTHLDNYNYWMAGSPEISPTAARDDSRFTYLSFTNNRDMPAVYSVDSAGNESLGNTHVNGNTIVIHRVLPFVRLRKGEQVVCVRNDAFSFDGGSDNSLGTIAPDVERKVKEVQ
jgi:type IV secretion system protein VirB9